MCRKIVKIFTKKSFDIKTNYIALFGIMFRLTFPEMGFLELIDGVQDQDPKHLSIITLLMYSFYFGATKNTTPFVVKWAST